MTDTYHAAFNKSGTRRRAQGTAEPRYCSSPPQHLPSNPYTSEARSSNVPRIWGGRGTLFGCTYRKHTCINTCVDVRLVCEEKFLLCNKTIEQSLLKPGDYLFLFLALQHHRNPHHRQASREHRFGSGAGGGRWGGSGGSLSLGGKQAGAPRGAAS